MVKLPYYRLQSLIVATEGYKYYCHFYDDYLQSVCLQTRTSKGLYGILKNTVFFWLDQPDRPLYKTEEDPIRIRKHSKEGLWSFPPNVSLPWAVDHNNITYTKVDGRDGEPGYYDVKFTPESPSKRFTKLEPISVNDMKLAEGINDISGRLRFVADVYFATIAEVNLADPPQGMLTPRWLAMDVESSASTAGLRVLNYRDITTKASTKVRTLEARSDGLFYRAKAFIFKFPLPEVQHGIMFYASNNALMLYRQDQVHLRHHDTLPSEFGKHRTLPRATGGLPTYQEAISHGVLPRYNSMYPQEAPPDYSATPQDDQPSAHSSMQLDDGRPPPPYSEHALY